MFLRVFYLMNSDFLMGVTGAILISEINLQKDRKSIVHAKHVHRKLLFRI